VLRRSDDEGLLTMVCVLLADENSLGVLVISQERHTMYHETNKNESDEATLT
jgi:hypothetical protein